MATTTTATIKYPFGVAATESINDAAVPDTITISNNLTLVSRAGGFGQAVTALNLLADSGLEIGARVKVDIAQGATGRNVTFGSGGSTIVAPVLTGVADDRDVIWLTWTGSAFVADVVWQKIVDAA
jgi:hypothetical protein